MLRRILDEEEGKVQLMVPAIYINSKAFFNDFQTVLAVTTKNATGILKNNA